MAAFKYFFVLTGLMLAMYAGTQLLELNADEGAASRQLEVPANMLIYAKEDVNKSYYGTAYVHIENAIRTMRQVGESVDMESRDQIEVAISELQKIERALNSGYLFEDDLNLTFANSLNALAYAYMKISEQAVERGDQSEAHAALAIAVRQLDYATRFASGPLFTSEHTIMVSLSELLDADRIEANELHPYTDALRLLVVHHNEQPIMP